jgi:peptidyl-prolyl cis-trans isomerase A (cyclophilin A)
MFKRIMMVFAVLCLSAGIASAAEVKKNPVVEMDTSLGKIKIELFEKEAPISVKNFLDYANSGFFTDTTFHRVIPGFMIQGGGYTADRKKKPGNAAIKNEAANGLKNDRGTISMARTSAPDSATSEFFINVADNKSLNRPMPDGAGYAVFGKVIEGMDVVDKIVNVKQKNQNVVFQNLPEVPVVIKSVTILK